MNSYLMCPNCRAELENYDGKDVIYCKYCRGNVLLDNAKILAENYAKILHSGREIDLNNLRKLMRMELERHFIDDNMLKTYCGEILQLLPFDYLANFYKVYCDRAKSPKDFTDFLLKDLDGVDEFAVIEVLDLLTQSGDAKFKETIANYINKAGIKTGYYSDRFKSALEKAEQDAERFSRIPRDVFICYVSNDFDKAQKVHNAFLQENISCFFAPYNLMQTTTESYWNSIKYAIFNCKVFLVISSYFTEFNPVDKNDAIKEMDIAEEYDIIQRLELKIDRPNKRTSKFKRFFENSWIEAYDDKFESGVERLCAYILDCIVKYNKLKAEKETVKNGFKTDEAEFAARVQAEVEKKLKIRQHESDRILKIQQEEAGRAKKNSEDGDEKNLSETKNMSSEAKEFFEQANKGNAAAQNNLGKCYYNGDGVKKDLNKAVFWYIKSAEQGHAIAQYNLGNCYEKGCGINKDLKKAVYWYTKSAEQGFSKAQNCLGICYEKGLGTVKDLKKAVYWYTKSAERDYPKAQYNLGVCYYNGDGIAKDLKKAAYWYAKSAENGYDGAQCILGICCEYGQGLEKDLQKALYWYTKSAEQNNASAQYILGWHYENDKKDKDFKKALHWYTKSAENGYTEAQYNLGVYYYNGEEVVKDLKKAAYWFTKAAEQENADAQCLLGICYEYGKGVNENFDKAAYWYTKSAKQGNKTAKDALKALKK